MTDFLGGLVKGLSGLGVLPPDDPDVKAITAQTELNDLNKQLQDAYAEVGKAAVAKDGPEPYGEAGARLALLQQNITAAEARLAAAKAEADAAAGKAVYCPACGEANAQGTRFCKKCGKALVTEAPKKRFCTGCGAELAPGTKFCSTCGTKAE